MRPVTASLPGQPGPGQHAAHRPLPGLGEEGSGQAAECAERRRREQRREPGKQRHQGHRDQVARHRASAGFRFTGGIASTAGIPFSPGAGAPPHHPASHRVPHPPGCSAPGSGRGPARRGRPATARRELQESARPWVILGGLLSAVVVLTRRHPALAPRGPRHLAHLRDQGICRILATIRPALQYSPSVRELRRRAPWSSLPPTAAVRSSLQAQEPSPDHDQQQRPPPIPARRVRRRRIPPVLTPGDVHFVAHDSTVVDDASDH